MKKSIPLGLPVLAGIAVLLLSSCTVEVQEPNDKPKPTDTTQYVAPAPSDDEIFLSTLYDQYPEFESIYGDWFLIELAKNMCGSIDGGMTPDELVLMVVDSGADPNEVGYILGVGVAVYCPWNEGFFDSIA